MPTYYMCSLLLPQKLLNELTSIGSIAYGMEGKSIEEESALQLGKQHADPKKKEGLTSLISISKTKPF